MTLRDLLGLALKSDEVLDIIELYDMTIVYEVDVLREGTPDQYSASSSDYWAELSFDENQLVNTVFCYVSAERNFSASDHPTLGVPFYGTLLEAKAAAESSTVPVIVRDDVHALGRTISYVRFDHDEYSRHYEYEGGELSRITMMTAKIAPRV